MPKKLLLADDGEVYMLDRETQTLTAIVAVGEYAEQVKAQTLRLGEGVVGVGGAERPRRNAQCRRN